MKKICVYTCITGSYDNINEIEKKEKNIDYLLFTNNKNITSTTWKVVYIEDKKLDNQRLSRKIKILGHPMIDDKYDISLWMDASVLFKSSINDFIETYYNEKKSVFSAFKHCLRNCIYDEAIECIKQRKDRKETIINHIKYLEAEKYPKQNGLYEMTVFIKNHNDPMVKKTMEMWFDMVCNYSKRDQLSFMYCVWKTGMKINPIELNVWDNKWFICNKHIYTSNIKEYRIYFGNESEYNYNNDIQGNYQIKGKKYIIDTIIPDNVNKASIEISKVPCIRYRNLKIKDVSEKQIQSSYVNVYNNESIFYKDISLVIVKGNFKKGKKFHLEVELEKLIENELYGFINHLGEEINNYRIELSELQSLKLENEALRKEINDILNSKAWKLIEKLRKVLGK